MNFPVAGSAQTYDSTSFAPDSASTATSIATGNKTWSGSINVSEDFTQEYETIAEKLKAQKDYKIGIISSVNLNHATPAAFYAHQASRNSYYEIGQELVESGFDYFAGGALLSPTGEDESQKDLYTVAEEAGYKVMRITLMLEGISIITGVIVWLILLQPLIEKINEIAFRYEYSEILTFNLSDFGISIILAIIIMLLIKGISYEIRIRRN